MYLTYDEYKNSGGELTDTAFYRYEYEAEMRLERASFGRIHNTDESKRAVIKECIRRVLELLAASDPTEKRVKEWRHDGVAKSFSTPQADDINKKISEVIGDFLGGLTDTDGVALLYRGIVIGDI